MKGFTRTVLVVGLLFGCVAFTSVAAASTATHEIDGWYLDSSLKKLGRGVANVITCPGELIRMTNIVGREDGYIAASTVGIVRGLGRTVTRGGVGVFEVLTFFLEIPENFAPIMQPEYVFAHGSWDQQRL